MERRHKNDCFSRGRRGKIYKYLLWDFELEYEDLEGIIGMLDGYVILDHNLKRDMGEKEFAQVLENIRINRTQKPFVTGKYLIKWPYGASRFITMKSFGNFD